MSRILWIAVADARGHLMRAHRVRRLLAPAVEVDIVTTSDAGVAFLAALGTPASRLGRGYALAFDDRQHLDHGRTNARLLRYLGLDAAGDVARLARWASAYDLIVNDALHPAALIASWLFDAIDVPIVHVYGSTLLGAVEGYGAGPLGAAVRAILGRAFARIEYAADGAVGRGEGTYRLRPLVDPPREDRAAVRRHLGVQGRLVVAYLNPHFADPRIARAIEAATRDDTLYAVSEGLGDRPGWVRYDDALADKLAAADVVVSAPGVATMTAVKAAGVPMVALVSRQPEQAMNLERARAAGRSIQIVDVAHPEAIAAAIADARSEPAAESIEAIRRDWELTLHHLIEERTNRCRTRRAWRWSSRPTTSEAATPTKRGSSLHSSASSLTSRARPTI